MNSASYIRPDEWQPATEIGPANTLVARKVVTKETKYETATTINFFGLDMRKTRSISRHSTTLIMNSIADDPTREVAARPHVIDTIAIAEQPVVCPSDNLCKIRKAYLPDSAHTTLYLA